MNAEEQAKVDRLGRHLEAIDAHIERLATCYEGAVRMASIGMEALGKLDCQCGEGVAEPYVCIRCTALRDIAAVSREFSDA